MAFTVVANSLQSAKAAAAAAKVGAHPSTAQAAALRTQAYHHALATGFSRGYLVSAGVLVLPVIIALFMMRVSRQDLSSADPAPAGGASSPNPAEAGETRHRVIAIQPADAHRPEPGQA